MKVRDVLLRAADIIETRFTTKVRHNRGQCCALGAIEIALQGDLESDWLYETAERSCPSAVLALAEIVDSKADDYTPSKEYLSFIHKASDASWKVANFNNRQKDGKPVAEAMRKAAEKVSEDAECQA